MVQVVEVGEELVASSVADDGESEMFASTIVQVNEAGSLALWSAVLSSASTSNVWEPVPRLEKVAPAPPEEHAVNAAPSRLHLNVTDEGAAASVHVNVAPRESVGLDGSDVASITGVGGGVAVQVLWPLVQLMTS
jgi:hypothetical protein